MTETMKRLRTWEPTPRIEAWIARIALVCAVVSAGIALYALGGLMDAQTKLRAQQARTDQIARQAQRTAAEACWRTMIGAPIIAARLYERFDVFADADLYRWYVGAIPKKCPALPEHLLPPRRYR